MPQTDTYLLFPYEVTDGTAALIPKEKLASDYPKAWNYLVSYQKELRAREGGKFDDSGWYRMGRTQNLDKQEVAKLLVPRLVARLQCVVDPDGEFYCDNADVSGVVPTRTEQLWYLAGILNSPVSNLIFSWLSKPFRGEYMSANKQFIAPLPVPQKSGPDRLALESLAKRMQEGYTARVETRADLDARLARAPRAKQPLEWLLPDVRSIAALEAENPQER